MILGVHNPRGGTGKTTTAANIAAVIGGMNRRVLLVDLDPYAGLSISLGVAPADLRPSIADVLLGHTRIQNAIRAVPALRTLQLLTGSPALTEIDRTLTASRAPERRLGDLIRRLNAAYDMVIVDSRAASQSSREACRTPRTGCWFRSLRPICRSKRLPNICGGIKRSGCVVKGWRRCWGSC